MEHHTPSIGDKVILIDDDPVVLAIITAVLSPRNVQVMGYKSAGDYRLADPLSKEDHDSIKAIMIDLHLTDCSGDKIMKEISEKLPNRPFKIFAISANSEEEALPQMCGKFYDVFLCKPFSAEQILNEI
jgi:DNA-binding response OmpR family regulator